MAGEYLLFYLLWINALTAYLFWLDWRFSKARLGIGEIPELLLIVLGFMGAALTILCMQILLRHRDYRRSFRGRMRLYLVGHFIALLMIPVAFVGAMA